MTQVKTKNGKDKEKLIFSHQENFMKLKLSNKGIDMIKKNMYSVVMIICTSFIHTGQGAEDSMRETNINLVARKDYLHNKRWIPKKIMGRDFWNCLPVKTSTGWNAMSTSFPTLSCVQRESIKMREINKEPMVQEAAKEYTVASLSGHPYMTDTVSISILQSLNIDKNVPFFIWTLASRPPFKCMKDFKYDQENYEAWKALYPNFMGFGGGIEWDCEFMDYVMTGETEKKLVSHDSNGKLFTSEAVAQKAKRELPIPKNRKEAIASLKKCYQAVREYYFNEPEKLTFLRGFWCLDHQALAWGADMIWQETTNTMPFRHQVSMFFARGATRQYNKKWGWYLAMGYNGFDNKGKYGHAIEPIYLNKRNSPNGMSLSLAMRDYYLAYLSGTNFVESEHWPISYCQQKKNDAGLWELAPHGKVMKEWYTFIQRNPDRGISYAPVALLVPFDQGYAQSGGASWAYKTPGLGYERPDCMLDAFMQTIVPFFREKAPIFNEPDVIFANSGEEGCLFNSTYGDIYDVITPGDSDNLIPVKVLDSYNVVVVLGKYDFDKTLVDRLMGYVKNGGTLVINIRQLNAYFTAAFLGFEREDIPENIREMYAMPVKGTVLSIIDSSQLALSEEYEFEKIKLTTAIPIMIDEDKNVLVCMNKQGKGNVIVTTVDYMLPKKDMSSQNSYQVVKQMATGKKFPLVGYLLSRIVKEVLPLSVKGDIEYGLNKVNDGWWLYLINNKGVTKFTKSKEVLDMSKTAHVEVLLKDLKTARVTELRTQKDIPFDKAGNSFSVEVKPGDIEVFKITVNKDKLPLPSEK